MKTAIFFIISIVNLVFGIYTRYPSALIFGAIVLFVSILFLFEKEIRNSIETKGIKEDKSVTSK